MKYKDCKQWMWVRVKSFSYLYKNCSIDYAKEEEKLFFDAFPLGIAPILCGFPRRDAVNLGYGSKKFIQYPDGRSSRSCTFYCKDIEPLDGEMKIDYEELILGWDV